MSEIVIWGQMNGMEWDQWDQIVLENTIHEWQVRTGDTIPNNYEW